MPHPARASLSDRHPVCYGALMRAWLIRSAPLAPLLACALLTACQPGPAEVNQGEPAQNKVAPAPPQGIVLAPPPPIEREALLLAAIRARSAAAAGQDDKDAQAALHGRRFQFRIRMGCSFAAPDAPQSLAATFDAEQRRVELRATPDISLDHPVAATVAGDRFEAAEGFWVPQPWLLTPACAAGELPGAVGLVQYFSENESRTARRQGRAYSARETLPEGTEPPAAGSWDLVLAGRLEKLGDGRVIHCRPPAPAAVPACLVSVRFDKVSIENAVRGEALAEWSEG